MNDATCMREALEKQHRFETLAVLHDADATLDNIRYLFECISKNETPRYTPGDVIPPCLKTAAENGPTIQEGDQLLVYIAGHGDEKNGFLCYGRESFVSYNHDAAGDAKKSLSLSLPSQCRLASSKHQLYVIVRVGSC